MLKRFLVIITLSLLLTGCYTTGNKQLAKMDANQIDSVIVKGQTTKAQVRSILGAPTNVDLNSNGDEQWTYSYSKSTVQARNFIPIVGSLKSGTNDQNTQLVVLFNNEDIVANYALNESQGQTTAGLLG